MFAWIPTEMPDVSQEVAEHTLNIKPGSKPIKQGLRASTKKSVGPWMKSYPVSWLPALLKKFGTHFG
jgi:hypothetical protein